MGNYIARRGVLNLSVLSEPPSERLGDLAELVHVPSSRPVSTEPEPDFEDCFGAPENPPPRVTGPLSLAPAEWFAFTLREWDSGYAFVEIYPTQRLAGDALDRFRVEMFEAHCEGMDDLEREEWFGEAFGCDIVSAYVHGVDAADKFRKARHACLSMKRSA